MAVRGKEEEELRKLSIELRYLEQTAETLQQRIGMVNAAITELDYATATMDGLEQENENAELLVPVGGSSYIKARLSSSDKVIIGLGAGVSIEKPLTEAKSILKERLDELQKSASVAQQQFSQVAERINSGRSRLETLLGTLREGKTPANV